QPITSLNSTVSITTSYDPATLPANFSAANLQIGYFDSNTGQWEPVAATIDTTNHTFTMQVNHFTQYGPILNGVPSAPTGLTATAASASEIDLSWTASPTATSYTIYRSSTNSNFTTSIATGVTGTAYSDTGLSAGTAYYYEVAGVNANGEGLNSSSATAATSAASSGGGSSPGAISPVIVSSGGGGSSTATNPLPVPTPTPTVTTQKATSTPPASATAFTTPAAPVLTRSLYEGLEGDDVSALQTYLVEKGYLTIPSGTAEGYFGALTKAAVVRFQKDNGVDSIGIVGPATRAAFGVATAARATAASAASSGTTVAMFASNLGLYTSSADVQRLQTFLNQDPDTVVAESGPGSPGHETDYFGLLTERAVEKFQAKYGIVLSGTPATTGYGRVGPETRAKLNALR
ncbi:MAG: peptidoglycan-binding protein, partial [Patescibacteria group bacterium]|nr:peptidoglycan-binding protein [Patescibacteria group bacterium]